MIAVNFYNFSKKENSTKRPAAGTAMVINCVLKDECSVESPVLELQTATPPALYTYAYIADFNRYYYVTGRSYYQGRWIVTLVTDILATFKDPIGGSTQYVLRSSSESDEYIVDNFYTTKGNRAQYVTSGTEPWNFRFSGSDSDYCGYGCYILGITSKALSDVQALGTTMYYRLTSSDMALLIDYLTTTFVGQLEDSTVGFSATLAKALVDPTQYIRSCTWYPFVIQKVSGDPEPYDVQFGWYDTGIPTQHLQDFSQEVASGSLTIHKHTQAATRGKYLNLAPYSDYAFVLEPWGTIPIDSSLIVDERQIHYVITVDLTSGLGKLNIYAGTAASSEKLIGSYTAQVGVPVNLTQITSNTLGAAGKIVSAAVTVGAAIASPVSAATEAAAIAGGIGGIGNGISSAMPYTSGGASESGSFLAYFDSVEGGPALYHRQLSVVDENFDHAGRPLCQEKQINTLSGYILCADGELDISCTDSERAAITAYLTGGFFYE